MNNGLFGFPPGKNITVDRQEFDFSGVWRKPRNAKFCIIEGTGGGQGGQAGGTANAAGAGGAAGCAYQAIELASKFLDHEIVTIGAGSANTSSSGGTTSFSTLNFPGGFGVGIPRNAFTGADLTGAFGAGIVSLIASGRHGNFGAGGGGSGGANTGANGNSGGLPRSFAFASGSTTAALGGGAPGGTSGSIAGTSSRPNFDRHGFGEGAGGGYGQTGTAGAGGAGRRGSGGGGGGSGTTAGGAAGRGGNGFLRVITYCWE